MAPNNKNNKKSIEEISSILVNKNSDLIAAMLSLLLSTKEIATISNRMKIISQLIEGMGHAEIAKRLRVGVATVTRGSKQLKQTPQEVIDIFTKSLTKK